MAKEEKTTFQDDYPLGDFEDDFEENSDDEEELSEEEEEQRLADRLSKLEEKGNKDSATLAKMLSDPDVRALLEAKEQGKKFSLKMENQEAESKEPAIPADTDDTTRKVMEQVGAYVKDLIKPLESKLKNVDSYVSTNAQERVKEEINAVREKYSDFDDYRQDMSAINKQNPGLSIEELYFLAKSRKRGSFAAENTDTEKPRKSTAKAAVSRKNDKPIKNRKDFELLLDEVLDNAEF